MLLIGQYQRSPQLVGLTPASGAPGDDATAASFTELPAAYKPPRPRQAQRGPSEPGAGRPADWSARAIGVSWQRWLGARLAWIGWITVGAALVVGGVVLGASLTSSSAPPPAADRPPAPPSCASSGPSRSSLPSICLVQSVGSSDATFVVRGTGFAPGVPVTVSISGVGPPPGSSKIMARTAETKPVTGHNGTLSLTVNRLFPGPYPPGLFTVVVTGPGGAQASADFMVIPPGPPPP